MRLTVFATAAVSSALALVGFAGVANASATVDLVWIDVSSLDTNGNVICLKPANRDCPQLGSTISIGAVTDSITLGVIITAGPGSIVAAGVDVDYNDALPKLSVSGFRILTTAPYLPTTLAEATNDTNGWVQSINAVAITFIDPPVGIGLPAGATAYLGTVTFHKDFLVQFQLEIAVGVDGPDGVSDVFDISGNNISATTTFNSASLVNLPVHTTPTATPAPTATPTPTPIPSRKVTVCHRGKSSLSLPASAVPAHLAHGDTLGACP